MPGKIRGLFRWCLKVTEGYAGVELLDMTSSWKDGLAFCAIINRFRPDLIDFYSLSPDNVYDNNDLAFSVMEKEFSITQLLDPSDMVAMETPDRYSIATYVSSLYEVFNDKPMHDPPPIPENWTAKKSLPKHKLSKDEQSNTEIKKQKIDKSFEKNDSEKTDSEVIINESQGLHTVDESNHTNIEANNSSIRPKTDSHSDEHDDSDIDDLFVRSQSVLDNENDSDNIVNIQSYKDLCQESIDDIRHGKQNVVLQAVVLAGVTAVAATTVGDEIETSDEDSSEKLHQLDEITETMDKQTENDDEIRGNASYKTMDSEKLDSHDNLDQQDNSLIDSGCFTNTILNNSLDFDSVDPNNTLKSESEELIPHTDVNGDALIKVDPSDSTSDKEKYILQAEISENLNIKESTGKTLEINPDIEKMVEMKGNGESEVQLNSVETKVKEEGFETHLKEHENEIQDVSITKETVDVLNVELNKGEISIEDVVVVSEDETDLENCDEKSSERESEIKNVPEKKMEGSGIEMLSDDSIEPAGNEVKTDKNVNLAVKGESPELNQDKEEVVNTNDEILIDYFEQNGALSITGQPAHTEDVVYDEFGDVSNSNEIKLTDVNQVAIKKSQEQNTGQIVTDNSAEGMSNVEEKDTSLGVHKQTYSEEAVYDQKVNNVDVEEDVCIPNEQLNPNEQKDKTDIFNPVEAVLSTSPEHKHLISIDEQHIRILGADCGEKDALSDNKNDMIYNTEIGDDNSSPGQVDDSVQSHDKMDHTGEAILNISPDHIDVIYNAEQWNDVEEAVYDKVEATTRKEITGDINSDDEGDNNEDNHSKTDTGKPVESLPIPSEKNDENKQENDKEDVGTKIMEEHDKPRVNLKDTSEIVNENFEKSTDLEPVRPDSEQSFAEYIATDIVNNVLEEMKSHPDMLDSEMDIQAIVKEIEVDLEIEMASQDTMDANFDKIQPGNEITFEEKEVKEDGLGKTNESSKSPKNDDYLTRKASTSSDSSDCRSGIDSPPPALPSVGPPLLNKSDSHDQESFEDLIVESVQAQAQRLPTSGTPDSEKTHKNGEQIEHYNDLDPNTLIKEYTNVLQEISKNEEEQEIIKMVTGNGDQNEIRILVTPFIQANEDKDMELNKSQDRDKIEIQKDGGSSKAEPDKIVTESDPVDFKTKDTELAGEVYNIHPDIQFEESVSLHEEQEETSSLSFSDQSLQQQKKKVEKIKSPIYVPAAVSSSPVIMDEDNQSNVQDEIIVRENVASIECEYIYPSFESRIESNIDPKNMDDNGQSRFDEEKENRENVVFVSPAKEEANLSSSIESTIPVSSKDETKDDNIVIEKYIQNVDEKKVDEEKNVHIESIENKSDADDVMVNSKNTDSNHLTHPDLEHMDKSNHEIKSSSFNSDLESRNDTCSSSNPILKDYEVISSHCNESVHQKSAEPMNEIQDKENAARDPSENIPIGDLEDLKEDCPGNEDNNCSSNNSFKLEIPHETCDKSDYQTDGDQCSFTSNNVENQYTPELKAIPVKMGEVKLDWSTKLSDPNGNIAKEVSLQFTAPVSADGDVVEFPEADIKEKAYAEIDKDLLKRAAIMSKKMAEKVTMRILDDQRLESDSNDKDVKDFETPGTPPPTPDILNETAKDRRQTMFQILQNSTRPTKKKFSEEEGSKTDEKNLDFASKMKLWNRRSFTSSDLSKKSATDNVPKKRISLTSPFLTLESTAPETKDTHMAQLTKILPDKPAPGSVAEYVRKISERKSPTVEVKTRYSRSDPDTGSEKSFDGKEKYSRNVWADIVEDGDMSETEKLSSENKEDKSQNSKEVTPSAIFSQRPLVKMRSKNNNVKIPIRPLSLDVKYEEENKDSSKPPLPPSRPSRRSLGKVNLNIKSIEKKSEENDSYAEVEDKEAIKRQDSLKKRSSPKRSLSLSSPTRSRSSSGERDRNVWIDQSTKPLSPKLKRSDSFEVKVRPVMSQKSPEEKYVVKKEKELERQASSEACPLNPPKRMPKVDVSVLPVSVQEESAKESSSIEKQIRGGRRSLLSLIGSIKKPKDDKSVINGEREDLNNVSKEEACDSKYEVKPTSKLYNAVKAAVKKENAEVSAPCLEQSSSNPKEHTYTSNVEEEIVLQVNNPVECFEKLKADETDVNEYKSDKKNTIEKCNSIFSTSKPKKMSGNDQVSTDKINHKVDNTENSPPSFIFNDGIDLSFSAENQQTTAVLPNEVKEELPVNLSVEVKDKSDSRSSESSSEENDDDSGSSKNSSAEINRLDLKEGLEEIIKDIEKEIDIQHEKFKTEETDTLIKDQKPNDMHETKNIEDPNIYSELSDGLNETPMTKLECSDKDGCKSSHSLIPSENQIVFKVTLNDKQIDSNKSKDRIDETKTVITDGRDKEHDNKPKRKKKKKEKCSDSSSESSQPDTDESDKDDSSKEENSSQKDNKPNGQSVSGDSKEKERKGSQGSEKSSNSSESQESEMKDEGYSIETKIDIDIDNEKEILASIDMDLKDKCLFVQDSVESTDFPDDIIQLSCDKDYVLIENMQDDTDSSKVYINASSLDPSTSFKSDSLHLEKIPTFDVVSEVLQNACEVNSKDIDSLNDFKESRDNKHFMKTELPDFLNTLPHKDSKLLTTSESDSDSGKSGNRNLKTNKKRKRKKKRSHKGSSCSDSSNSDSDKGEKETMKPVSSSDDNQYEALTEEVYDPNFDTNIYDQLEEHLSEREINVIKDDADTVIIGPNKEEEGDQIPKDVIMEVPLFNDVRKIDDDQILFLSERLPSSSSSSSSSDSEDEDKTNIKEEQLFNEEPIKGEEMQSEKIEEREFLPGMENREISLVDDTNDKQESPELSTDDVELGGYFARQKEQAKLNIIERKPSTNSSSGNEEGENNFVNENQNKLYDYEHGTEKIQNTEKVPIEKLGKLPVGDNSDFKARSSSSSSSSSSTSDDEDGMKNEESLELVTKLDPVTMEELNTVSSDTSMIDDISSQQKKDDETVQIMYDLDSTIEILTRKTDVKKERSSISSTSSSHSDVEVESKPDLIKDNNKDGGLSQSQDNDSIIDVKLSLEEFRKIEPKETRIDLKDRRLSVSSTSSSGSNGDDNIVLSDVEEISPKSFQIVQETLQSNVFQKLECDHDLQEDVSYIMTDQILNDKPKDMETVTTQPSFESSVKQDTLNIVEESEESGKRPETLIEDNNSVQQSEDLNLTERSRQNSESSTSTSSESDPDDNADIDQTEKNKEEQYEREQSGSRHNSSSSSSSFESAQEEIDDIQNYDLEDNLLKIVIEDSQPFKAPLLETVVTSTEQSDDEINEEALEKTYSSDDLYTNNEKDVEEKIYLLPECNMIKTEYDEMDVKGSGLSYNILDIDYKPEPIDIQVFVIPDGPIDKPMIQTADNREAKDVILDSGLDKVEPSVLMSLESLPDIQEGEQIFYDDLNTDDYLVPRELRDIILEPVSDEVPIYGRVEDADVKDYLLQNIIQNQARVPVVRRKKSTSSSSSSSEDMDGGREYENTGLDDEHVYQTVDYDDLINDVDSEHYEDGELYEDIIDDNDEDLHKVKEGSSQNYECSSDDNSNTEQEIDRDHYQAENDKVSKVDIINIENDIDMKDAVREDISKETSESSSSSSSSDSSDDEEGNRKDLKSHQECENIDSVISEHSKLPIDLNEATSVLNDEQDVSVNTTVEDFNVPYDFEVKKSVPHDVKVKESINSNNMTLIESILPHGKIVEEFCVSDTVPLEESIILEKYIVPSNVCIEQSLVPYTATLEDSIEPDGVNIKADVNNHVIVEDSFVPVNENVLEETSLDKRIDGESTAPDRQQSEKEANFMIGREKDPSKSEVARLIQQSLELDRKREELRRQEQERLQDSIQPRDEVLEKEHQKHLHDPHEQLEREEENVDLDESSLEDEVEAEEKEISEGQFSEEYQAGEATPMSMPSGVDTDNSVSSPEDGDSKPVVEVFDLQESSSEDISPDMESQALFVKLKEAQLRIAVLEAELAKLKAKLIVLENADTQKKQLEKKNEEMAARLRETEKSLTNTRKEINHYQDLLEGSQGQYIKLEKKMSGDFTALEKKYHKAKKLIKEYQQREKDFVAERESLLQQQTEKDQQYNALVKSLKDKIFLLEGDLREAQKAAGLPVLSQEPTGVKSEPIVTPVSVQPVRSAPLVHDSGSPVMSPVGDKDSMSSESENSSADVMQTDGAIKADKVDLFESMPVTAPLDTSVHKAKAQVANNSRRPPTKQRSKSQDSDEMADNISSKDESGLETWIKHDSDNTVKKSDVRKRKAQQQGLDPHPQSPPPQTADPEPSEVKVTVIEPLTPEEHLPPPPPPPSEPPASLPDVDPVVTARERGDSESNDSSSTVSQSSYDPTKPNFRSKDSEIPGLDTGSVDFPETQETESESSSISAKKSKGFNLPKLPFKFGGNERDKGGVMLISSRSLNTGEESTGNEGGITLISKKKIDTGVDFDGASTISTVSDTSSGYMVGEQESTSYSFSGTPASEDHPSHPTAHILNQFQACPISEWNTEHVRTWLIGIEMDKYIPVFTEKSINGVQLVNLDANKLKAMGISNSKDRDIFKKKVKELKLVLEKERKQLEKERKQMEKEQKAKEKEQKKLSKKK